MDAGAPFVKIVFAALHFGLYRNFESVVLELARRGHDVILLADENESLGGEQIVAALAAQDARIRWQWAPSYEQERWFQAARRLRQGLVYLRFLEPRYAAFAKLLTRAEERTPRGIVYLSALPGMRSGHLRRALTRLLEWLDGGMPRLVAMDAFLSDERPDALLVASATIPRSPQLDHMRSARAIGIPTGACVYSWDHLSSKGLIRIVPDRVLVWNEVQRREAIDMHGLPAGRIVVTGAQVYDQWFGRQPSRTRERFLADAGLPPDRPFLLYVCSALTPDPRESLFVRTWVESIRASANPELRRAGILIRPHPERRPEWDALDWSDLDHVVISGRSTPGAVAKADYFDALFHSTAVVGSVTSAFLEAAVAGRPVLTITPPELRMHQEGMLHFRYLLEVEDGLLTVARTLDEHVGHLEALMDGRLEYRERQQRFLRAFVRPSGLETPATPAFVEAVEALAREHPAPAADTCTARQRRAAAWMVQSSERGLMQMILRDRRDAAETATRDERVRAHRRAAAAGRRKHQVKKLVARIKGAVKRVVGIS